MLGLVDSIFLNKNTLGFILLFRFGSVHTSTFLTESEDRHISYATVTSFLKCTSNALKNVKVLFSIEINGVKWCPSVEESIQSCPDLFKISIFVSLQWRRISFQFFVLTLLADLQCSQFSIH